MCPRNPNIADRLCRSCQGVPHGIAVCCLLLVVDQALAHCSVAAKLLPLGPNPNIGVLVLLLEIERWQLICEDTSRDPLCCAREANENTTLTER
jgi:hypothetical protein